jgi:CBS domain-containing protein
MKDKYVKNLMIPLAEYATVSQEATLYEAIQALRDSQATFNQSRYPHRAILVYGKDQKIVGKLSQMDIIKSLEPDYAEKLGEEHLSRFGISDTYIQSTLNQYEFWNQPLKELCKAAGNRKVSSFMYTPTEGEYVTAEATLQEALHRLVIGNHHSLLVTDGSDIVGVLRLTDMFTVIHQTMDEVFQK